MRNPKRANGFTLIEMLVACAASTILMLAVLSVVALIKSDRVRLQQLPVATTVVRVDGMNDPPQMDRATGALTDLIRRDLINAREYREDPQGKWLALRGYGGLNRNSLAVTGLAADVTYRISQAETTVPFLVREQQVLGANGSEATPWRELAQENIERLELVEIKDLPVSQPARNEPDLPADPARWQAIPQRLRLTIVGKSLPEGRLEMVSFR